MIGMWFYNLGMYAYTGIIKLAAQFKPKARQWITGRRDIFDRLSAAIPTGERIVWVHAASLGEFEQGRPIIEAIRRDYPEYKILLTFFSPSGYEVRKNYNGVDFIFYLPADTPRNARRFLDIVKPEAAIFIKYEFWLNYLAELRKRNCRTFIISAIFRPDSVFFRFYGGMYRRALKTYETIFVQNPESGELLKSIGMKNVVVAGDTRFDRVAEIARAAKQLSVIESFASDRSVLVAGSTWGPDEDVLQPVINNNPDVGFVVAPHEIEISRISSLTEHTVGNSICYTECGGGEDCSNRHLIVIDTIGILSSVYRYGDFAYIGGGFGVGIHNTLEAVTFGLPIAFGPNYHKFREARELIALGVATAVNNSDELARWLNGLRSDAERYARLQCAARDYIAANKGATKTIVKGIFGEPKS